MGVENNVYLAKLAEQAERYEGKVTSLLKYKMSLTRCPQRDG